MASIDIDARHKVPLAALINSPRSLEAFKRTGITPKELERVDQAKLREAIQAKTHTMQASKDVFELRLLYANKARQKKLQLLRDVSTLRRINDHRRETK